MSGRALRAGKVALNDDEATARRHTAKRASGVRRQGGGRSRERVQAVHERRRREQKTGRRERPTGMAVETENEGGNPETGARESAGEYIAKERADSTRRQ